MHYISCLENARCQHVLKAAHETSWRILYFFFDFRGGEGITKNLKGFCRSLLAQLCELTTEFLPAVLKTRNGVAKIEYMTVAEMHGLVKDVMKATPWIGRIQ